MIACRIPATIVASFISLAATSSERFTSQASAQPDRVFKAEVAVVEVEAHVIDGSGRFVDDLTAADFVLLEDGKPQTIQSFSRVNAAFPVPTVAVEAPTVAPDVRSNVAGFSGRVYLLVLDDLQTTPLLAPQTRAGARNFVERYLTDTDIAAVVFTSGRTAAAQDFTSDRRRLLAAINKFSGTRLTSLAVSSGEVDQSQSGGRRQADVSGPNDIERASAARNSLDALRRYARMLEPSPGRRRALIYFSEGLDYDISAFANSNAAMILDATRAVIAAAARANIAIYGIDARGLVADPETVAEIAADRTKPTLSTSVRRAQDSLRILSDATGGFAIVNENDLPASFARVVGDASAYYSLGYTPANQRRQGRFRSIDVRSSRPGLTIRARRGYVEPTGDANREKPAPGNVPVALHRASISPIPVAGLPLEATAVALRGTTTRAIAVVSTTIDGRELSLHQEDGRQRTDLDVAIVASAFDRDDAPAVHHTVNVVLTDEDVLRLRRGGFRVVSALDLEPGHYQLRVAAREANAGRVGSVVLDLDVPDFSRPGLAISALALTSVTASDEVLTARPRDPFEDRLPGVLSTQRTFARGEEIGVFAEVSNGPRRLATPVAVAMTLRDAAGRIVFETTDGLSGERFAARIPLTKTPPGAYLLRLDASLPDGTRHSRETTVRVISAP
jgi:VWFA-related protein